MLGEHGNTLEFTKDLELTKNGDCIIGVNSDFKVTKEIINAKKIKISIHCDGLTDSLISEVNSSFDDSHEIVIRKTGFLSKRTLGINASKAAIDIDRRIIKKLTNPEAFAEVKIEVL